MILTATSNVAVQVKVINLKHEYPGFTGDTNWAVITDLSEEELVRMFGNQFGSYGPFLILSLEEGEILADFNRNEDKHAKRQIRSGEAFGYEEGTSESVHEELVSDTLLDDVLSMALKNFLYNMYSKDISQKVTTAMQTRIKMGQHMSAFAAYGYRKNPEDIHQLIVDETSAAIVRRIYQMAADGIGKSMIARTLNEEGVKTPIEYMNSIGTNKRSLREMEKKLWATNSVGDMIRNEVYLGKLVWNKSSIAVMGSHKQKKNPRSKWLIVEGSHEPLVSQELFDLANEKAFPGKKRTNTKAKGGTLLHCGSCGRIMNLNGSNKGYRCAQACSTGLPECRIIKAPRFEIEDEILQKTKEKAAEYLTELKKNKAKWHHDVREWKGTDALKEKESKLSMKKMRIYDQFKSGKISQDTYSEKMAVTNVKLKEIRQELADIKKRASEAEYNLTASVELEEKFKAIMKLEEYSVVEIKKLLDYVTLLVDGTRAYVWKKKV